MIEHELREHWWAAVASLTRLTGDLASAQDAVQDACVAAMVRWPREGTPPNPGAWLVTTAKHKALDRIRREARRPAKERAAALEPDGFAEAATVTEADQLGLIFMCCHPALDPDTRIALTLRAVCGLSTAQIASVFLLTEPAVAKRLVRARRKIRDTGIRLVLPSPDALAERLDAVLRVVYLVFTEGHRASAGAELVRGELCDAAVSLARTLWALLPGEPEVAGLLALLLLTDARRDARTDEHGGLVLLEEQDRSRYDRVLIGEGEALLESALRRGQPGPYQIQAAIAACHSTATTARQTDWREIAALHGELLRHDPNPVHEANRAVALAMAEGPSAGLVILEALLHHPRLARWPAIHIARADLLHRLGRHQDAVAAYRTALGFDPNQAERRFIHGRIERIAGP